MMAAKPECRKGARRTGDQRGVAAPASFAIEAEVLGAERDRIWRPARTLAQQERCRLATQRVAIERWRCDHAAPGERLPI